MPFGIVTQDGMAPQMAPRDERPTRRGGVGPLTCRNTVGLTGSAGVVRSFLAVGFGSRHRVSPDTKGRRWIDSVDSTARLLWSG